MWVIRIKEYNSTHNIEERSKKRVLYKLKKIEYNYNFLAI